MDCVNPSKVRRHKWDYCTHPFIHPPPLWALQLEDQWPRLRARKGEGYALWRHPQILERHLIHQTIMIVFKILQLHMVCDMGLHASSVWIVEDGELLWPQDCVETLTTIKTYLCLLINYGSSRRLYQFIYSFDGHAADEKILSIDGYKRKVVIIVSSISVSFCVAVVIISAILFHRSRRYKNYLMLQLNQSKFHSRANVHISLPLCTGI